MGYQHIQVPSDGDKITVNADFSIEVPDRPIIPYIEGDGIGSDITPVMIKVTDAAVQKAYGGKKSIAWMEVFCGEKAADKYDGDWFPEETLEAIKDYVVGIKGPLTTPVGGGFRSLNVALRQEMDLYVCQRPVRWFTGVPSPVKEPNKVDMIIFRERDDKFVLVGRAPTANWVRFQAAVGKYSVRLVHDPRSDSRPDGKAIYRTHYRFQIQGPEANKIFER